MLHHILLVSADPLLAERVRRALPAGIPSRLHSAPRFEPASDPRGWLLVLLDVRTWQDAGAGAGANEVPEAAPSRDGCGPVLWLGDSPRLMGTAAEVAARATGCPGPIVDYLDRNWPPSKLSFSLHQHLAGAYLRRLHLRRGPGLAQRGGGEWQRQLNNALTGILGNAELAMESSRRLAPPIGQRLERIAELAAQMRDLLTDLPLQPS